MADSESLGLPQQTSAGTDVMPPESPDDSALGLYSWFPYSPEPFVKLSQDARSALITLDQISTQTDEAARRFEVEESWESWQFDRGYQHLLRDRRGGWKLPGQGTGYGSGEKNSNSTGYNTNIFGPKGDIITAALSREIPKVEFFASNPEYGPDIVAAEEANNFKDIWARNNNAHDLLVKIARIFWNDERVLLWTYYGLNAQKYGFEKPEEAPTVPENILEPPSAEPTGQPEEDNVLDAEESPKPEGNSEDPTPDENSNEDVDDILGDVVDDQQKPLGMEVTKAFGVLDHKVPIACDLIEDMPWAQISIDADVTIAKAMFPWIAEKINPGTDGQSDTQLDRIARQNVRQAVLGAYVTGDSLSRQTTIKFTWLRPSMFLDKQVNDAARAELLENFPNGCLMVKAGSELAFARNESMDDHLAIGHAFSGMGQNRRSLGSALISIQKRINDWVDLLDDFFKRTVPKKWYNAEAFDMEAMKKEPNVPGSSGPFQPQPGMGVTENYIMVEPTPQPQAALSDFIKWFITGLSEEISGALPSLFGAATGEQTATNGLLQNSSALQRIGCPWNSIQDLFAVAAKQAVKCAAECRDGKKISQNLPGKGIVSVNSANLLRGNVLCYPESNPSIPESWEQREMKLLNMIDASSQNPMLQAWLMSPDNISALADGIRMKQFKVPGAVSVTKQKCELELLLRSGPQDNPAVLQGKQALAQAMQGMQLAQATGQPVPPQAQSMVAQVTQTLKSLPPMVSSVPVAQDDSENHIVEASWLFDWGNGPVGQKLKYGTPQQKAGYANAMLHRTEHLAVAKKLAAQNAPPPPVKPASFSGAIDKLPPEVSSQILAKSGIQAPPQAFAQHTKDMLQEKIYAKTIPDVLTNDGGNKPTPQPGQDQQQPRQLRR